MSERLSEFPQTNIKLMEILSDVLLVAGFISVLVGILKINYFLTGAGMPLAAGAALFTMKASQNKRRATPSEDNNPGPKLRN